MHHAGDDARARRSLRTEVHLKRAVLHSRASRYDKAIGDYNEVLKGEGANNAHAWLWRGVAFHAHGSLSPSSVPLPSSPFPVSSST